MTAAPVTLTISRTLLGLGNLALPNGTIDFEPLEHSGRHWDRTFSQSPYAHGRDLTGARMQPASITATFFIDTVATSSSPAVHATAMDTLLDALSQFTYTITQAITISGATQTDQWACEPADIDPGPIPYTRALRLRRQLLRVTIPISPVPAQGVW